MPRHITAALLALTLVTGSAIALAEKSQPETPPSELAYGEDELQRIDLWPGSAVGAPLVVFVHGGGWKRGDKKAMKDSAKLSRWQEQGYAVASVNYRLVPRASVEEQAQDVADAVAQLKRDAERLGYDAKRLVLVGHSAGAHLVALVGTDPAYLDKAGLGYADIDGILALDGAAYDIPRQMNENGRIMSDTYVAAFGTDRERQEALSPMFHADAPNADNFLLLHVERPDGAEQSRALAAALREAGISVEVRGVQGRGLRAHMEINRRLGEMDYPATAIVDRWLAERFLR